MVIVGQIYKMGIDQVLWCCVWYEHAIVLQEAHQGIAILRQILGVQGVSGMPMVAFYAFRMHENLQENAILTKE